ncbi:MAG: tetratricopeptide repeat protein [PVC group bacterium]
MSSKDNNGNLEQCVPLGVLERYALGSLSGEDLNMVMDHLKECALCSRRFEILTGYFTGPPESYSGKDLEFSDEVPRGVAGMVNKKEKPSLCHFPQPETPLLGQIWRVRPEKEGRGSATALVVLLPETVSGEGEYRAGLLSWEVEQASERDLAIGEDESPLGIGFIVEIWNTVSLRAGQLERCVGVLSADQQKALKKLAGRKPGEEPGVAAGEPIRSLEDERIYFQSLERRRTRKIVESGLEEDNKETIAAEIERPYSLAGVSSTALLSSLKASFARAPEFADSASRSFFLSLKKFYRKYLIPVFPIAVGFAFPVIAHLFFRRLSKSMTKSRVPSPLKPETELLQGLSYCGLGRWQKALAVFSMVMAHPATLFAGLVFSAWILARMGKFKQAEESIRRARELPKKVQTFEIDFDRIQRFIEEEREAEFKEWFDNTIGNYILKETARLISSL